MRVVIKLDLPGESKILNECIFLRSHSGKINRKESKLQNGPFYIMHDHENNRRYLVTKYLEFSLLEYLK